MNSISRSSASPALVMPRSGLVVPDWLTVGTGPE
jgi:hypothetical protein